MTRLFETVADWQDFRASAHRAATGRDHHTRRVAGCRWCDRLAALDAEFRAERLTLWEVPMPTT